MIWIHIEKVCIKKNMEFCGSIIVMPVSQVGAYLVLFFNSFLVFYEKKKENINFL